MKDEEFVKLLTEYAEEIKDPANKARYEAEIAQMEEERGMSVVFINPKPGHVLKTRDLASGSKVFINICSDSNIAKPTSRVERVSGRGQGLQWSIPYSQSQPRQDIDKSGETCMVYDVIFHQDSIYLGERDHRMRNLLHSTALDALEKAFSVRCERTNLKFPKMKFKGVFRPTIIRRPISEQDVVDDAQTLATAAPPSLEDVLPDLVKNQTIKPTYTLKYRSSSDLQDHVILPQDQVVSSRPKDLLITVSLPLLDSAAGVDLDVQERSLSLTRDQAPAYALFIDLPYPVDEEAGSAKFDKSAKSLLVTLPIRPAPQQKAERLSSNDSGIEEDTAYRTSESCSDDSIVEEKQVKDESSEDVRDAIVDDFRTKEKVIDSFLDESVYYSLPSFSCAVQANVITFILEVKNVAPSSLEQKLLPDRLAVCLKFSSIGAGYVQIHHAFALDFLIGGKMFDEKDVEIEIWDNNVVLQLPLDEDVDSYKTGLSAIDLADMVHRVERDENGAESIITEKKSSRKRKNKYKQEKHPNVMPDEEKEAQYYFKEEKKERHSSGESLDSHMSESPVETIVLTELQEEEYDMKTETESCDEEIQLQPPRCTRAISEESAVNTLRPRGILKRKTTEDGRARCYSESNMDEMSAWSGCTTSLSETAIMEGEEGIFSSSQKKSVRFNEQVQQQLYRINSAILANTAKNRRKAEKKKRALERRMSEGDVGSLDSQQGTKVGTSSSVQDFLKITSDKDWTEGEDDSGLASSFEENLVLTGGEGVDRKPAKGKKMTKKRTKQFQMTNELIFDLDI